MPEGLYRLNPLKRGASRQSNLSTLIFSPDLATSTPLSLSHARKPEPVATRFWRKPVTPQLNGGEQHR